MVLRPGGAVRTQPGISTWFQPQEPSNPAATRPEAEGAPIARENDLQKKRAELTQLILRPFGMRCRGGPFSRLKPRAESLQSLRDKKPSQRLSLKERSLFRALRRA
jgi:hypothetical protein